MSLIGVLGIIVGIILIIFVLGYAFCGVIAFPFYLLGLFGRLLFFPISVIKTYIYPVGSLPILIITGFWAYLIISLLIKLFRSLGYHK